MLEYLGLRLGMGIGAHICNGSFLVMAGVFLLKKLFALIYSWYFVQEGDRSHRSSVQWIWVLRLSYIIDVALRNGENVRDRVCKEALHCFRLPSVWRSSHFFQGVSDEWLYECRNSNLRVLLYESSSLSHACETPGNYIRTERKAAILYHEFCSHNAEIEICVERKWNISSEAESASSASGQ